MINEQQQKEITGKIIKDFFDTDKLPKINSKELKEKIRTEIENTRCLKEDMQIHYAVERIYSDIKKCTKKDFKFTLWDLMVLLVLAFLLIGLSAEVFLNFISLFSMGQNYQIFIIDLLLLIFVLLGFNKYQKKLLLNYKNPKTKNRSISFIVIIGIIVGYFLLCLSGFFN